MGDIEFRRLKRFRTGGTSQRMELSIPVPKSPTGKRHQVCPSPNCVPGAFQLGEGSAAHTLNEEHRGLVRRISGTPGMTCPYCGTDDLDQAFVDPRDVEAAKRLAVWAAKEDVKDAIRDMVQGFAKGFPKRGPISVKFSTSNSHTPQPFFYRNDLLREVSCDICTRSYGVYAAALFCPDCGARNIHVHFEREIELINQQIAFARQVEESGNGELAYRLLGNAHEDVLTALEAYHKAIYQFLVRKRVSDPETVEKLCSKKKIGNAFQSVERGRDLYQRFDYDPYGNLQSEELECLHLNVHKRHVIGHNLGVADEAYASNVVSRSEKVGETVPVLADDIARFAYICKAVIVRLEEESPEFLPRAE